MKAVHIRKSLLTDMDSKLDWSLKMQTDECYQNTHIIYIYIYTYIYIYVKLSNLWLSFWPVYIPLDPLIHTTCCPLKGYNHTVHTETAIL